MNKKRIVIIVASLIVAILILITYKNQTRYTKDEIKFKKEYESINNKKTEGSKKKALSITIPKDSNIKYIEFPECPWCRNAIPVLINAAKCECIEQIYYFNALSIRDIKHLDDNGKIITDKKGTKDYYEIVKLLGDKLSSYDGLNDQSIKRLYFPTVVFVRNGEIVDIHSSTVESQTDPYIELTKAQKSELQEIYEKGIRKMKTNPNVCDKAGKTTC